MIKAIKIIDKIVNIEEFFKIEKIEEEIDYKYYNTEISGMLLKFIMYGRYIVI